MNRIFTSLIIFCALWFAACGSKQSETVNTNQSNVNTSSVEGVGNKFFSIEFKTDPAPIRAGEKTKLIFTLKSDKDEIIKDLQIVHEKPMHLLIVSDDLEEFSHEHPELQPDGSYAANFAFPNGGGYRLFLDFTPFGAEQVVKDFPVAVSGAPRAQKELKADEVFEKTIGDLRFVMKPSADLIANRDLMLEYQVFDAKTDAPVTDLENYLGAKAHFVVISEDLEEFVHAHPMSDENVKSEEHTHEQSDGKMNGMEGMSIVSAHISFPKPAIYKVWAQFKRAGKVINVPFTLDVKQGEPEKRLEKVEIPKGAFKIVVSKDGFTPEEVTFQKGQPLKLAFYRIDEENCANEIVFKSLNIKKSLPLGEVVLIDIPTNKTGEINFACGMNMYKGKVVIE
ncbi:MAG TPA: cupredoxin domain-containing protein [Pyrinomonadaceae bacterium]|jgi:hypothetical protein